MKRLVVVSGAGRSGTSTVAGALSMLGLHLPQPEVPADESNPRGFFESQWVVDLHKRELNRSPIVRTIDSRPEALDLITARSGGDAAAELASWLDALAGHPQVLVKDPRAFWFHDLWRTAAAGQGARLGFVTMVRHPSEVARSRDTHYVSERDESFRRQRATANVAAWCNAAYLTEEATRPDPRVFVRYPDLLTDWRRALAPVTRRLDLELDPAGEAAVDAFIEPGLRRSQTSWDEVDVPDLLRDLAEATFAQLDRLVEDPDDTRAREVLAALREDYARFHDHAVAVALDHTGAREVHVRRNAKANTARAYDQQISELQARIVELEAGGGVRRRLGRGRH